MSDAIIHHINVSYDESDARVVAFVKHLKYAEGELEGYYRNALAEKDGKTYATDREGNEFTLVASPGHNCLLYLRGTEKL